MRRAVLLVLPLLALALATARGDEPARKRKVKLDLGYYEVHITPIVQGICAECHADPTRSLGRYRLKPPLGEEIKARHVRQNFKIASRLVKPGRPDRSFWILKPLAPHQGGLEHGGGQRIVKGSAEHRAMVAFVNGATYEPPAAPAPEPPRPPPIVVHALTGRILSRFEADAFAREGDVVEGADEDGVPVLRAGEGGGTAVLHVEADAERQYGLELIVRGPGKGYGWRLDDRPWHALAEVAGGEHQVGSDVVYDGSGPVRGPTGRLRIADGGLVMRGAVPSPASWQASVQPAFDALETAVRLPPTDAGRQDALLLFGMADADDGYFVGLLDGCTTFAVGRLDEGRPVVHASVRTPDTASKAVRRLGIRRTDDGVRGLLDGEAAVFLRVVGRLDGRPFGLLTRGALTVERFTARADGAPEPVYEARFEARPAVRIPAGRHVIRVALPAGAPALRSLILEPPALREDD